MAHPCARQRKKGEDMYRFLAVLIFATVLPLQLLAQDAPRAEVFGGFQYYRANTGTDVTNLDHFNLNGWNASLSGYFNRYLGVTADFSGAYGSPEFLGVPLHTKLHIFMFGPVLRLPNPTHLTPFVHALGGAVHTSFDSQGSSTADTSAAWAVGGGLDLNIAPILSVRLAQVDYLQTRTFGDSQNNFRYSAGIVLRF
jgi:outer membrane protein with beta-barrel domain